MKAAAEEERRVRWKKRATTGGEGRDSTPWCARFGGKRFDWLFGLSFDRTSTTRGILSARFDQSNEGLFQWIHSHVVGYY